MTFAEDNQRDRIDFVHKWAKFVRENPDEEWSRQQNVIINSSLKSASISREEFFEMKGEENYEK